MTNKLDISIVIPAKDEQASIPELSQWIARAMHTHELSYEALYIDDGSTDHTWEEIVKAHRNDIRFKGIRFNRNYGKAAALQTGFDMAQGSVIVTLDADLQDSPEEIPDLYRMITQEGYQLVSGWKKERRDPLSKTLPSKLFNLVTRKISRVPLHDFNCGIKAYHYTVVKSINVYGEMHRYIPILAKWEGFTRIGEKTVRHASRKHGQSKFGRERFIRGFLDLISVMFMGKFRRKPMHFFGSLGVFSFLLGFVLVGNLFYQKIDALFISKTIMKREIVDQPIFYIALSAIIVGVQLFLTGYLAEMIALQSAAKRSYLIADKIGAFDASRFIDKSNLARM